MNPTLNFDSIVQFKINLTPPNCQRILDPKRVDQLVCSTMYMINSGKQPLKMHFSIAQFQTKSGILCYLIDGQHRFSAAYKLVELNVHIPITVDFYFCKSEEDISFYYKMLNDSNPPPEIYLSDFEDEKTKFAKEIEKYLINDLNFKSGQPNRPYINRTMFINKFFTSDHCKIIKDISMFIKFLSALNEFTYRKYVNNSEICKKEKVTSNMIAKCSVSGNYIGLDKDLSNINELKI